MLITSSTCIVRHGDGIDDGLPSYIPRVSRCVSVLVRIREAGVDCLPVVYVRGRVYDEVVRDLSAQCQITEVFIVAVKDDGRHGLC